MALDRSRQPKGKPIGGQFAPNANPEADLELSDIGEMEGSDVSVECAPADFDGWDLERVNDLFPDDAAGELSKSEWNELTKRAAASAKLNDLEELKRYEIGKIYDAIVAERGETAMAPANRSEEVFDVEYQEGDGFCHSFFEACDGDEAARKAMVKHNLHPRDIVGATKCNESLGKIQHRLIWANGETLLRERGHEFLTGSILEEIPDLYATESTQLADKMIYAHYFLSNGDWYIAELDKDEGGIAFGHCDLGMGYPEWGEVSLIELEGVRSQYGIAAVVRDLDFTPATARQLGLTRDDN
jgi:hypothetical protein